MSEQVKKISCRDTTYLVSDARDRVLTEDEMKYLGTHLSTCSACQIAAAQFKDLFSNLDVLFHRR